MPIAPFACIRVHSRLKDCVVELRGTANKRQWTRIPDEEVGVPSEGTESEKAPLLPVMQEFKNIIEEDPQLYMLFSQMFDQVPHNKSFGKDPTGKPQIKNYRQMLEVMNRILTTAPEFNNTGLVGFPINAIINWPMGTPAGTSVFLNEKVNYQLKKVLNQWAVFLRSADSRYVLNDNPEKGWFGRDAKRRCLTL